MLDDARRALDDRLPEGYLGGRICFVLRETEHCTDGEFEAIEKLGGKARTLVFYHEDFNDADGPEYCRQVVEVEASYGSFTFTRLYLI